MSLESKIENFLNAWGTKLGDSAIKAVNDAVGYKNQTVDLQIDDSISGTRFSQGKVTYVLAFNKDYWRFIHSGVNGTENNVGSPYSFKKGGGRIPIAPIEGWIAKRGLRITVKEGVKGKAKGLSIAKGRKSLAFAIGTSTKKKGIKPKPFTDKILTPELNDELIKGLGAIMASEVVATFKTIE